MNFKNFLSYLKDNEENAISFLAIAVIVISFIVIIVMWINNSFSSNKSNIDTSSINAYTESSYDEVKKEYYSKLLTSLLKFNNSEKLYSITSLEYLNSNSLNEQNFKNFLIKNNLISNTIDIISCDIFAQGNSRVYRFYYKAYSDYKYVNVIEKNPNEYEISFDQDISNISEYTDKYNGSNNNVNCELELTEKGENYARFNIRITNNNAQDVYINLNNLNTFSLIGDGISIPLSSVVAENISSLSTGSSINRELYFSVSNEDYTSCKQLRISNIEINGEYFDILINIWKEIEYEQWTKFSR